MNRNFKQLSGKTICLVLAIFIGFCSNFFYCDASEEFPEGMTQEEKNQMLSEMYEDIEADKDSSTESSSIDYENLSDEELQEKMQESMPSEEEIKEIEKTLGEQVFNIATFKTGYDKNKKLYKYTFSSGGSILISVPIGGYTDYAVALMPEDGAQIMAVTIDGTEVSELPDEDGAYLFRNVGQYSFLVSGAAHNTDMISGTFRILDATVPITNSFICSPEGYSLKGVKHDGTYSIAYESKYIELKEDGIYELFYEPRTGTENLPEYSIILSRDTTPPTLDWIGEIQDGMFVGQVKYELTESDTQVEIYYNGQPAISESHVLASAGNYYITATDKSGNERIYNFTILRTGHIPWKAVVVVIGVLLIISVGISIRARRTMNVKQSFNE